MKILGISCYYHDSAAALIIDGRVVAATEEERFSRMKHDNGFPTNSIDFCLQRAGIKDKDLDYVVFYEKPFRKLHRIFISGLSTYPRSYRAFSSAMKNWISQKLWIKQDLASYIGIEREKILFSDHHLSHAASTFYPSPFKKAAIITFDGVGEWTTTSWGKGVENEVKVMGQINYPHSIGLLYSAFTAFLGFRVNSGEWKVMGLAPYGNPRYKDKVLKTVNIMPDGSFRLDLSYFSFHYSGHSSYSQKFVDLFGSPIPKEKSHLVNKRAADIASSIQSVSEDIMLNIARFVREKTKLDNLCIAGGVGLNSVANYIILKQSGFKNIYIQPACGDSGGALGSALGVYHRLDKSPKRYVMNNAYLGKEYDNKDIKKELEIRRIKYQKLSKKELINYVVKSLLNGQVVGWFQGRFEWGPRALGNRSILADARNPKMKDIINAKVKFREAFRPFAPSVLAEYADQVFELPLNYINHHPLRYMLYVVPVRDVWQKKVPAITHADKTARPQLVLKKENPLYHELISAFYKKTKVPLVLNTSFNLRGDAIVNTPANALDTFYNSGIDILVMGNLLIKK